MINTSQKSKSSILSMAYISLFAVIIAICSWISIPSPVPFTLQTFAVFSAFLILGGKKGTFSVLLYIALGAIGLPVFSGFRAGIGVLFGATGGYILGFLLSGLIYYIFLKVLKPSLLIKIIALLLGLITCYFFGTVWFIVIYTQNSVDISLMKTISICVLPFIIPDILKMALAIFVSKRLERAKHIHFIG